MVYQLLVHGEGLVQVLLCAGGCPARERNLLLKLLHSGIATVTVLDHAEGLGVLASLISCRLGHRLGCFAVTLGAPSTSIDVSTLVK